MPTYDVTRQRLVLALLLGWGLVMVVPDLNRPFHPLSSFGISVDNDGLVTDVHAPFIEEQESPAWQAGVRPGDRLDQQRMVCLPIDTLPCATAQALLGGLLFVTADRHAEIALQPTASEPARTISLVARTRPFDWSVTLVLLMDQIASVVVILAAAWLVFTRQSAMTWAFFLYVVWFNPGQPHVYYAWLQLFPAALLLQNFAGALAQGVGLTALLVFVVRAPADHSAAQWQALMRAMPFVAAALTLLVLSSYANVFGYGTEALTRTGVTIGFVIAAVALAILLARRSELAPAEYQRLRWVFWGCAIGLPALILADLGQQTTFMNGVFGEALSTDATWDLLRLVNGILCLFVFEAVRRPRVVSVAIPLRRVTLLGLLLSFPALLLHHQVDHVREGIREKVHLPAWAWIVVAAGALFAISRVHEYLVHIADHHLNRHLRLASQRIGATILGAQDITTVDRALSTGVGETLGLTSTTLFHVEGSGFRSGKPGPEERGAHPPMFQPDAAFLRLFEAGRPFETSSDTAHRLGLTVDPGRTILAVPILGRFQRYGLVCYGEHISGTAFNRDEHTLIAELAKKAADVYAKFELQLLYSRVEFLEQRLNVSEIKTPEPYRSL